MVILLYCTLNALHELIEAYIACNLLTESPSVPAIYVISCLLDFSQRYDFGLLRVSFRIPNHFCQHF